MDRDSIRAAALALSRTDRLRLASELLESVDDVDDEDAVEAAWAVELDARASRADDDPGGGVPLQDALHTLRSGRLKT